MIEPKNLSVRCAAEKKVNILLSTYNGMQFLDQQIQSLLSQSYPHIAITIRDDGSNDGTYDKLLEYAKRYPNFEVFRGERMGVVRSYFNLLQEADPHCDFYAFCDQDDVWLADKVRDAVVAMESYDFDKALLYCSRLEYVDTQLRHLGYSKIYRQLGFTNALVENVVTGCTIMLNREARKLICEYNPVCATMHDAWCYLVVSAFGEVIFDKRPNIKYRQHRGNVVGAPTSPWQLCRKLLARYLDPDKSGIRGSDQAKDFYRYYSKRLSSSTLKILEDFVNAKSGIRSRIKYAKRMAVWKQSRVETAALRLRIIMGRF
ncbi:MAG: glycosyltransferase family 2 protein [Sedimentisphaerales bacterium]|nr:glycosyltransferase family 2 protein [Sedimentisphaerales bacterium]